MKTTNATLNLLKKVSEFIEVEEGGARCEESDRAGELYQKIDALASDALFLSRPLGAISGAGRSVRRPFVAPSDLLLQCVGGISGVEFREMCTFGKGGERAVRLTDLAQFEAASGGSAPSADSGACSIEQLGRVTRTGPGLPFWKTQSTRILEVVSVLREELPQRASLSVKTQANSSTRVVKTLF